MVPSCDRGIDRFFRARRWREFSNNPRHRRFGGSLRLFRRNRFGLDGLSFRGGFSLFNSQRWFFDHWPRGFLDYTHRALNYCVLLRKVFFTNFFGEVFRDRVGRHADVDTFTPHFFD